VKARAILAPPRSGSRAQFDQSLNWKDVEWIRSIWPGKLIIKGILDIVDAREAVKAGAEAIVVSNHGGRQLDGAPSSISVLPEDRAGCRRADRRKSCSTAASAPART
jgi:L-lactate dehydrogenase (cytochrome)